METMVRPYVSFAQYLEGERDSDVKHEWFDGAIYAMSRGTPEHARLSSRIGHVLTMALAGDCEVYSGDLMLYIAESKLSTYADTSVVCGPLETATVKKNGRSLGEAVTNPTVIVEVLSESTERYDREEKFAYYRHLRSFEEYVLLSQDEVQIEVYRRPASGDRWERQVARAGGTIVVHGRAIAVDEVYGNRPAS